MKSDALLSEKQLFEKISQGNTQAFRLIFEQYHQRMLSFVCRLVKSPHIAEEIVQESFIKLWECRDMLAQVSKPDSFFFIIVRNNALSYLRKVASEQRLRTQLWEWVEAKTAYTDMSLEAKETEQLLNKILAHLPPQKQKIFRLSRDMGLSQQEIADQLALSKSTVKNHMVESLKAFKDYLKKSGLLSFMFW